MASKPCVQRTYTVEAPTVVPPNSLEWVAYLALRFIYKSLWQPRGSSLERKRPRGYPMAAIWYSAVAVAAQGACTYARLCQMSDKVDVYLMTMRWARTSSTVLCMCTSWLILRVGGYAKHQLCTQDS